MDEHFDSMNSILYLFNARLPISSVIFALEHKISRLKILIMHMHSDGLMCNQTPVVVQVIEVAIMWKCLLILYL